MYACIASQVFDVTRKITYKNLSTWFKVSNDFTHGKMHAFVVL
jgi:hypothetical protein